jgi:hypothetical protein
VGRTEAPKDLRPHAHGITSQGCVDPSGIVAQDVQLVMGPQDPKDVTEDTARNLSALVGELAGEGKTIE